MPIGGFSSVISTNPITSFIIRVFGTSDLHSHFRVRPLIEWVKANRKILTGKSIVEIGCGSGTNIFEINQACPDIAKLYGFDLNKDAIECANSLKTKLSQEKVEFFAADCTTYALSEQVDIILLMDILEHLNRPQEFLSSIVPLLHEKGLVIISVPTTLYSRYFGKEFHNKVGHVRDGFTLEELTDLLEKSNLSVDTINYNTGFLASLLCYFYYNLLDKLNVNARFKAVIGWILSIFSFCDYINGPHASCSMFLVAHRQGSEPN
ncbi:MAG: methyltransferase domain-containing protein [Chitinophagia bacterium]|nr:methyltransferase domain-containing protein [Chitinophagia bacterium]